MHILHIVNGYGGTEVYKNLFSNLDILGIKQTVFVPLNASNHDRIGNQMIDFNTFGSEIIYSTVLSKIHKYLYNSKINTIVKDIESKVDMSDIDIIHAHTLCLDGAAAFELSKKYGLKYLVAVRNTDVNSYYKFLIFHRPYFSEILKNAKYIVFISPVYKKAFFNKYASINLNQQLQKKTIVMPNGVDTYFLSHRAYNIHDTHSPVRLLFVAAFKKGKGLIETIYAVDRLREKGIEVEFKAIGKGLPGRGYDKEFIDKIEALAKSRPWISLLPFKPKEELVKEMSESDIFIMPSKPETFGLVYVEALSQNLPIIYTRGEGFDGFYEEGFVGYPAIAGNIEDISIQIEKVVANYASISTHICHLNLTDTFNWQNIAQNYQNLYL